MKTQATQLRAKLKLYNTSETQQFQVSNHNEWTRAQNFDLWKGQRPYELQLEHNYTSQMKFAHLINRI